MKPRRFCIKLALALVACLAMGLYVRRPVQEILAVAALEEAMEHSTVDAWPRRDVALRIIFGPDWLTRIGQRLFGTERWSRWYTSRLRFFVQGPIDEVIITSGRVRGDVRAALARLPKLRSLTINTHRMFDSGAFYGHQVQMTERDLDILRDAGRTLPGLENVVVRGAAASNRVPPIPRLPSPPLPVPP